MKTRKSTNTASVQNPTLFEVGQTYERISYAYEGNRIEFRLNGSLMINATEMAKPFGHSKRPQYWLKSDYPHEFMSALTKARKLALAENQKISNVNKSYYGGLVTTQRGGVNPGTWMHEDVALEFARWLSPEFAIWCNDRIKEILLRGYTKNTFNEKELYDYMSKRLSDVAESTKSYNQELAVKFGFNTELVCSDITYGCLWNEKSDLMKNIGNLIACFKNNTLGGLYQLNKTLKLERDASLMRDYLKSISQGIYDKFNIYPN